MYQVHEIAPNMPAWERKANRIIAEQCAASWRAANVKRSGTLRKKHVPYHVPPLAAELLTHVKAGNEVAAKSVFIRLAVIGH